jgi:hypothetical protein
VGPGMLNGFRANPRAPAWHQRGIERGVEPAMVIANVGAIGPPPAQIEDAAGFCGDKFLTITLTSVSE